MADPFSAWGPEASGVRLAERDALFNQMEGLKAQEMAGKIAMQPVQQDLLFEQARRHRAMADQEMLENDAARRLQREMQEGGELSQDPIEALQDIAMRGAKAGSAKVATEALQRANAALLQRAQANRALTEAEKSQAEGKIKQRTDFAGMLGTVTDQAGLDRANTLYEQMFAEPSPMRGQAFEAGKVKAFADSTLTANQRLTAEVRRIEERGRNWSRAETARHNKVTEALNMQDHTIRRDREKRLEKAGGRSAGTFSLTQLREAGRILKDNLPDLEGMQLERAKDVLASRASEIRRGNPAIGWDMALQQAYNEEVESGSFKIEQREFIGIKIPGTGKRTFVGGGTTAETALEPPLAGDRPDISKFRKDRWYRTPAGVRRYLGDNKWEAAQGDKDEN